MKIQLLLVLAVTLWMVIIASSFLIRYFETNRQLRSLEDRSHHTVELTSTVLGQAIADSDLLELEMFIYDTIFRDINIVKAEVYDAEGNQLLAVSTNEIGNEMTKNPDNYVVFEDPILFDGASQGTIKLTWNMLYVDRLVEERDTQTQSLFDPLLLTLAVLILIFGYLFVTRPMDMISQQIKLLLETKDKDLANIPPLRLNHAREWVQLSKSTNLLQKALVESQERQQSLQDARDLAVKMSKMKSEFLTNISHELRTPLNGIIGISDLMMGTDLDEEQQEYSEMIRSSGNDLLNIISKILNFSNIEEGDLKVEREPYNILNAVEQVMEKLESDAAEKGLELSFTHDLRTPNIIGDEARVCQVLFNLVENGIKFTTDGGVEVKLTSHRVSADQATLQFDVCDSGIGIEPAFLPNLFEPFEQVDASLTRKYGGNGLGLAISQNLAHLMGGTLSVETEVGKGSTFTFIILADLVKEPEAEPETPHVLLLEPNMLSRKLLLTGLRKLGYSADFISDAADMGACLSNNRYSHVLIDGDILWGNLQQYEIELQDVKRSQLYPAKWILLISGDDLGYKLPDLFDEVLAKPVSVKKLGQTLNKDKAPQFEHV
ncbi:MAG: ATP-binding protein [Chloroflexota bacterium]